MNSPDALVLISATRLQAMLDDAAERAARRALKGFTDREPLDRPGKEWLTSEEAMRYLGISKPTLARRRRDGSLPYSKVGSACYYRREDVLALIAAGAKRQ